LATAAAVWKTPCGASKNAWHKVADRDSLVTAKQLSLSEIQSGRELNPHYVFRFAQRRVLKKTRILLGKTQRLA
jgi:hypothetical protein